MKVHRKHVLLYLKIFMILMVLGILVPYLLDFLFGKIIIHYYRKPSDNYSIVMYTFREHKSIFDVIFKLLGKVIEF